MTKQEGQKENSGTKHAKVDMSRNKNNNVYTKRANNLQGARARGARPSVCMWRERGRERKRDVQLGGQIRTWGGRGAENERCTPRKGEMHT